MIQSLVLRAAVKTCYCECVYDYECSQHHASFRRYFCLTCSNKDTDWLSDWSSLKSSSFANLSFTSIALRQMCVCVCAWGRGKVHVFAFKSLSSDGLHARVCVKECVGFRAVTAYALMAIIVIIIIIFTVPFCLRVHNYRRSAWWRPTRGTR